MSIINSSDARKLTIQVIEKDLEGNPAFVEEQIRKAIEKGKFHVDIDGFLSMVLKDMLNDSGYIVVETDKIMTEEGLQYKNVTKIAW